MTPTQAAWTLRQLRECVTDDEGYRFLIHNRDGIYSSDRDASLKPFGLQVSRARYGSPHANSFCGTADWNSAWRESRFYDSYQQAHIRQTLESWTAHYQFWASPFQPRTGNAGSKFTEGRTSELQPQRHYIPKDCPVVAPSILGGSHHGYSLRHAA